MKTKSDKLKLTIELVPSTSWYNNLRKHMSKTDWDKIRHKTYDEYGQRCGICQSEGRLNCHEIWEYDDNKHVQKLIGFIALCNVCHFTKHIGIAGILSSEGKLDYEKIVEHFTKVNSCDRKTFEEHKKKAFDEWKEQSQHKWKVDLGKYQNMIKRDIKAIP